MNTILSGAVDGDNTTKSIILRNCSLKKVSTMNKASELQWAEFLTKYEGNKKLAVVK